MRRRLRGADRIGLSAFCDDADERRSAGEELLL
jgi:hypothetical protein